MRGFVDIISLLGDLLQSCSTGVQGERQAAKRGTLDLYILSRWLYGNKTYTFILIIVTNAGLKAARRKNQKINVKKQHTITAMRKNGSGRKSTLDLIFGVSLPQC